MTSHVETNRVFGFSSGRPTSRFGLLPLDNNSLNMQFGSSNNVHNMLDEGVEPRSFGLQSRNFISHSSIHQERVMRTNQDLKNRNNISSTISKPFWPAMRNTTLTTGLQMQDSVMYNEDVTDEEGFRRPAIPRVIRGRSSILSSRLFHNQSSSRHYKDLSNVNGFKVSHISRRCVDSFSESRLPLNTRSNCLDNQSISESVLSVSSMKAQFMNVLENLHHSLLNIGPNIPVEAVRMEFNKAKEGLEKISDVSFAPSTSVISQSSKTIYAPTGGTTTTTASTTTTNLNGGLLNLKSSKDLLKTLVSNQGIYHGKSSLTIHEEEGVGRGSVISSSRNKESDEEESILFMKSKPQTRKPRSSREAAGTKAPKVMKSSASKGAEVGINLQQWYPIAVGSHLVFCGVDEKGSEVKTEPVKKRVNSRKVQLVNGLNCNLIGSPSTMVSVLPRKIAGALRNGLTERWRVFQKELSDCQVAEEKKQRKKSETSMAKSQAKEKENKNKKRKSKSPKVKSTPAKAGKVLETKTRSGRAVKPPAMFWLATGNNEVTSTEAGSNSKKHRESCSRGTPSKKSGGGAGERQKRVTEESPKGNEPPRKGRKAVVEQVSKKVAGKPSKVKSPKARKKGEKKEEVQVHSSTDSQGLPATIGRSRGKRRREPTGESESVETKKSKMEVESAVKTIEKKGRNGPNLRSVRPKKQKSPAKRKKETVEKRAVRTVTESEKETGSMAEFEKNFEFVLDDISIPEIPNRSGNTQLSRSQLRLVSMETPPLKYFNTNLKLFRNATPVRSPDWFISQRSESEVRQFQRRREEAFRKKVKTNIKSTVTREESHKQVQNRDVKRVMEWVAEKTVKSPQWTSKVLQYVIPSRKRMEQEEEDEEEEEEDFETEFL